MLFCRPFGDGRGPQLRVGVPYFALALRVVSQVVSQPRATKVVFLGKGGKQTKAIALGWPAPDSPARQEPARRAQESSPQSLQSIPYQLAAPKVLQAVRVLLRGKLS